MLGMRLTSERLDSGVAILLVLKPPGLVQSILIVGTFSHSREALFDERHDYIVRQRSLVGKVSLHQRA